MPVLLDTKKDQPIDVEVIQGWQKNLMWPYRDQLQNFSELALLVVVQNQILQKYKES